MEQLLTRYTRLIRTAAHFLREWWRSPRAVGAVCASSEQLADRMVQWVKTADDGYVVELGGGTGAVTAALLRAGVPRDRLIVIEQSSHFVQHLRGRFPGVRVVHGDAADVDVATAGTLPVKTIVSGLPLRSLPADMVEKIGRACAATLAANGRLIQFTYALRAASPWHAADMMLMASETVWLNLPPARIEVFQPCNRHTLLAKPA